MQQVRQVSSHPRRPMQSTGHREVVISSAGPFNEVPPQFPYLIVLKDAYSKWPEVLATNSITSSAVINFFGELFTRWGNPEILRCDQGVQFVNAASREFLSERGIQLESSPAYFPQPNGLIERFNRTLINLSQTNLQHGNNWQGSLREILQTYRSLHYPATLFAPFTVLTGGKMTTLASCIQSTQKPHYRNIQQMYKEVTNNKLHYSSSYIKTQRAK